MLRAGLLIKGRDMGMRFLWTTCVILLLGVQTSSSEETLFSGPQVGERLVSFDARQAFGDNAGQTVDVLNSIETAPTLLIFVHQVTRPSIGVARLVMNYAIAKKNDGLQARLVFLSDDPTETEAWFRRARRALPAEVSPLISTDGIEGPGAYGLNRKMTMTVIVANGGKVTANFPLVQPSIQADASEIGYAIVKALGGETAPTLKEMGFDDRRMNMRKRRRQPEQDAVYRRMMAPVIRKNANPADVDQAAKQVEEFAKENRWFRDRVFQAANKIVRSGKLSNYGGAEAQQYLRKWAKTFGPDDQDTDDGALTTSERSAKEPAADEPATSRGTTGAGDK